MTKPRNHRFGCSSWSSTLTPGLAATRTGRTSSSVSRLVSLENASKRCWCRRRGMQSCANTASASAPTSRRTTHPPPQDARRQKTRLIKKLKRGYTVNGDIRVWHLYVIELDDAVGPRLTTGSPGSMSERQRETPKTASSNTRVAPATGTGPLYAKVVRDHGIDLRRDLYEHLPPLYTAASAKIAERRLVERLATPGYSVKGGH